MRARITANPDSAFDALQFEQATRDREQREEALAEEIERLDGLDYREFLRLRHKPEISEPDLPLDEASYRDYRIRRNAGEGRD